jgi:thiopeptide-type bacteriocin biosynthesis protein
MSREQWIQANVALSRRPDALTSARAVFAKLSERLPQWRRQRRVTCVFFTRKPPDLRLRLRVAGTSKQVRAELLAMLRGLRRAGALTRFFFSVYEPEIHLFGGLAAMQLVHRHFDADTIGWMELDKLAQAGQRTTLAPDAISNAVLNDLFVRTIADRFEVWDVWRNLAALNDAQRFGCNEPFVANDIASLLPRLSVTEARTLHRYARANSALADGLRRLNDGGRLHVGLRGLLPFIAMFHLNRHGYDQARQANLTLAMCRAWDPHAGLHGFTPDSPNVQPERAK